MAAAAQTFTIQLNSSAAERTSESEERYQIALTPAIEVPYLAQPRAQLESLAFSNSFTNVSAHLDNNKIALQLAYTKTAPDASGNYVLEATLTDKRYELTIPDGHYDAAGLEEEMARQAYLTHKASDKVRRRPRVPKPYPRWAVPCPTMDCALHPLVCGGLRRVRVPSATPCRPLLARPVRPRKRV